MTSKEEAKLENLVIKIFRESRNNYGTRKIKKQLERKGTKVSRLDAAGGARTIIDEAAIRAVAGYCQGVPRIINSVMTNALILGTQLNKTCIDTEVILSACNNLMLG
jgi:G:T-mismatch repair DNA endonuclease (very short patch repair protein)